MRRLPDGRETEQHAGQQRDGHREKQHTAAEFGLQRLRLPGRAEQVGDAVAEPESQQQAARASQRREHQAFGQQLPRNA
jgi:hypothetical protein